MEEARDNTVKNRWFVKFSSARKPNDMFEQILRTGLSVHQRLLKVGKTCEFRAKWKSQRNHNGARKSGLYVLYVEKISKRRVRCPWPISDVGTRRSCGNEWTKRKREKTGIERIACACTQVSCIQFLDLNYVPNSSQAPTHSNSGSQLKQYLVSL